MRRVVGIGIIAGMSLCAEPRLAGPSVGYAIDTTGAVRSIGGVPGAASFREPVALDGLRVLAVSSARGFVVAVNDEGVVVAVNLTTLDRMMLEGAGTSPDSAVLSASGSAVLLLWKDGSRIQAIKNLPDTPALAFETALTAAPSIAAISDSGAQALFAIRHADADLLYAASADGLNPVQSTGSVKAIAFSANSSDAVFADAASVYRLRDGGVEFLTEAADTVALYATSQTLLIGRVNSVIMLNLSDRSTSEVTCGCSITSFRQLRSGVYSLNSGANGPLWTLDTNGSESAFYFVPQAGDSTNE